MCSVNNMSVNKSHSPESNSSINTHYWFCQQESLLKKSYESGRGAVGLVMYSRNGNLEEVRRRYRSLIFAIVSPKY